MSPGPEGFTLGQASLPMRLMTTLFLLCVALGFVSAQINLMERVGREDGVPGPPSLRDVQWHFAGNPRQSRLARAISPGGVMAMHISGEERAEVLGWIEDGAREDIYRARMLPIFESRCLGCHATADGVRMPILGDFDQIRPVTQPGQAMTVAQLALVTHQHALSIPVFLVLLGTALWLTHAATGIKVIGMVLPLLGTMIDLSCWWLTALVSPAWAVGVFAGGVMMGLGLIPLLTVPLWEMWLRRG